MKDLIARLEKTNEPDREVDLAIMRAISGEDWKWHRGFPTQTVATCDRYGPGALGNPACSIERFTESIDDAVTLAGDRPWSLRWLGRGSEARVGGPEGVWEIHGGQHHSPAVALCIAALKARSRANASSTMEN